MFALDVEGPRQIVCRDGLTVPWRPVLDSATEGERLHPGRSDRALVHRGYWFVRCAGCGGAGGLDGLPPEVDPECVPCRGTGFVPLAMAEEAV